MNFLIPLFETLSGINPKVKVRKSDVTEAINRMKFSMYNNITKEISYMVYEGHFDASSIKDMTPYERGLHLKYIIDRIVQYNESIKGKG